MLDNFYRNERLTKTNAPEPCDVPSAPQDLDFCHMLDSANACDSVLPQPFMLRAQFRYPPAGFRSDQCLAPSHFVVEVSPDFEAAEVEIVSTNIPYEGGRY